MYIPVEKAPPEFMQRYHAIMNGQEKLDTVAKLKDFWLFAVEQGWKSYEMREYVALLTEEVSRSTPLVWKYWDKDPGWPSVSMGFEYFRDFKGMHPSPFKDQTDERFLDEHWKMIEEWIEEIDPKQYE